MNLFTTLTPIGLGTWMMEKDPQPAVAALRAGIDAGSNHIDTAEMYGDGRVETIVGEALKGLRHKVYLVSKVLPSNSTYDATIKACERSLKRLQTDFLDVYLLHWRDRSVPLEETFRAFEKLKDDGKIKSWGVSNFDVKDMEEAAALVGADKIACNQVYYSITERAVEFKVLPWCIQNKVALVAYSPLGQGKFPQHAALSAVAAELSASPAQVALAFLIRNKDVIAIPKSSDAERTVENVHAMNLRLTDDHVRRLDAAFPAKSRRGLPTI